MFRGFTINNSGYVFEAGAGPLRAPIGDRSSTNPSLWKYIEATDTWEEKKSFDKLPEFYTATIFSINNKAYLTVGTFDPPVVNGQLKKDNFWEYNADTNQWTQRTDVPGKERFFSQSFSIGNRGYVGVGTESFLEDIHEDFWEYTPE
jgi:hypothetical protein